MNTKRRHLVQRSLGATAAGMALAAGLLSPQRLLAAWPARAFAAEGVEETLRTLGTDEVLIGDIGIKAPTIAEDGEMVPVTVSTTIEDVEAISILVARHAHPLVATYRPGPSTAARITCRMRMAETSELIVLVEARGAYYSAVKEIYVTRESCGG